MVAAPVLRFSPVLGDLDLIYIIKSKGPDYWRVIAARKQLSDKVMDVLADTKDIDTAIALVENTDIALTDHTLTALSDIAQGTERVAGPLLRRDELTDDLAKSLYQFVSQELKNYITENYDVHEAVLDTVDDIVLELVDAINENDFQPTPAMLKAAERFKDKGLLTVKLMLGTLRRGQIQSFIAQLSRFSGLDPKTIEEILMQQSGQGLSVVCKAFSIIKPDFVSIYLLTNSVRNCGRMVDLQDMTKAVNYFNRISEDVAKGIMKNSLMEGFKE